MIRCFEIRCFEGWLAIEAAGLAVDYFEARHGGTLRRAEIAEDGRLRLLVAARLGKMRPIDPAHNAGRPPENLVMIGTGDKVRD